MFFIVQINWLETSYLLSEQVLGTCLRMREIAVHQDSVRVCVCVCVCVRERERERGRERERKRWREGEPGG